MIGVNAVISRATHGVWGQQIPPGAKPGELEPLYARLLEQFERRRAVELGDSGAPPLPTLPAHRRRPARRRSARAALPTELLN